MKTDITFLLDRSGSMQGLIDDTIGGFNSLIEDQKRLGEEVVVTLCQFDNEFQTDYEGIPISEVAVLDRTTFVPRGMTALIDAIGRTISATEARLVKTPADNVMVVIVTDGHENASKEFSTPAIKTRIEKLQDECKSCGSKSSGWNFVFTGANIDSFSIAGAIGIQDANIMNYQATSVGSQALYSAVSSAVSRGSSGGTIAFTDEERSANS